jgi:hypothetical protein
MYVPAPRGEAEFADYSIPRGRFRITETAPELGEYEGRYPLSVFARDRFRITEAAPEIGEHEGRYPLIW